MTNQQLSNLTPVDKREITSDLTEEKNSFVELLKSSITYDTNNYFEDPPYFMSNTEVSEMNIPNQESSMPLPKRRKKWPINVLAT